MQKPLLNTIGNCVKQSSLRRLGKHSIFNGRRLRGGRNLNISRVLR